METFKIHVKKICEQRTIQISDFFAISKPMNETKMRKIHKNSQNTIFMFLIIHETSNSFLWFVSDVAWEHEEWDPKLSNVKELTSLFAGFYSCMKEIDHLDLQEWRSEGSPVRDGMKHRQVFGSQDPRFTPGSFHYSVMLKRQGLPNVGSAWIFCE